MNTDEGKSVIQNVLLDELKSGSSLIKLKEAEERYHSLRRQIESAKEHDSSDSIGYTSDWTRSYKLYDKFVDIEELESQKSSIEQQISSLKEYHSNFLGHSHDHRKEKEIFDLSNDEKVALSERYLVLAMSKEKEACILMALQLYKIALSYSDYIFPETDLEAFKLRMIRYAVLINLGNICCSMKHVSEARHYAESSLKETNEKSQLARSNILIGKIHHSQYEYRWFRIRINFVKCKRHRV